MLNDNSPNTCWRIANAIVRGRYGCNSGSTGTGRCRGVPCSSKLAPQRQRVAGKGFLVTESSSSSSSLEAAVARQGMVEGGQEGRLQAKGVLAGRGEVAGARLRQKRAVSAAVAAANSCRDGQGWLAGIGRCWRRCWPVAAVAVRVSDLQNERERERGLGSLPAGGGWLENGDVGKGLEGGDGGWWLDVGEGEV